MVQEEKAEGASRPSEKLQGLDKALTADKTAPPNDSSSTGSGAALSASDVAGASTKPEEVKTAAEGGADKSDRPRQVPANAHDRQAADTADTRAQHCCSLVWCTHPSGEQEPLLEVSG